MFEASYACPNCTRKTRHVPASYSEGFRYDESLLARLGGGLLDAANFVTVGLFHKLTQFIEGSFYKCTSCGTVTDRTSTGDIRYL